MATISKPLRLLLVGDSANDIELLLVELRRAGFAPVSQRVETAEALETALEQGPWDAILADDTLGGFDAPSALRRLGMLGHDLPFIVVSGNSEDGQAGELMRAGAKDYLLKSSLARLGPVLERELRSAAGRSTRHTTARHQHTQVLNSILNSMGDGVVVTDEHGKILFLNPAAEQILGICAKETAPAQWSEQYGLYLPDQVTLYPPDELPLARAIRGESVAATELFVRNKNSPAGVWTSIIARPLRNEAGDRCGGVVVFQDITERKRVEENLRNGEELIRLLLESTAEAIYGIDREGDCTFANAACARILGYAEPGVLVGKNMHALMHHRRADGTPYSEEECNIHRNYRGGNGTHVAEDVFWRADGTRFFGECWSFPVRREGRVIGAVVTCLDITERKNLEEQLGQAQKMEAVGQLAGGIAHDFNNFLTAIKIYNHLLVDSLAPDAAAQQMLEEINKATERAASLTRQLLAFSCKQVLAPQILCLNEVVRDTEQMLRRMIGEDVQLVTMLDPWLDRVKADPEQLERVLLNLLVNARDAMPHGGKLTIETKNVALDGMNCQDHADVPPGRYVMLAVTDSGVGMSGEVVGHIFEPFFTTKKADAGSGLGLSVVHGIIKQSEGHIGFESEPGRGACFKIYLPRAEHLARSSGSFPEFATRLSGTETILLVEDDEVLRTATCRVLQGYGYNVLEAGDGDEALRLSSQYSGQISLLVTDLVMPRSGGRKLSERLLDQRPALKTLFVSGYPDGTVVPSDAAEKPVPFLHKPYSPVLLGKTIRAVLDGSQLGGPSQSARGD